MNIKIFAFGKLKTPGLRSSADYYLRLMRPWSKIEENEIEPLKVPAKTPALRASIQLKESLIITQKLHDQLRSSYLLDETGKSLSSQQWALLLKQSQQTGNPAIFLMASSLGFHPDLKKRAQGLLSLGPQTMSHELSRVVLFEQIFRGLSILHNHPYHNEG